MQRSTETARTTRTALAVVTLIAGLLTVVGLSSAVADDNAGHERYSFGRAPSGWHQVDGSLFDGTQGWVAVDGMERQCGKRNAHPQLELDTFCHTSTLYHLVDGVWQATDSPASWKKVVPNGTYDVTVTVGEASFHSRRIAHSVQAEGTPIHNRVSTTNSSPFKTATKRVTVTDGVLDLTFIGGTNTKIVTLETQLVSAAAAPTTAAPTTAAPTTAAPTTAAPTTAAPTTAAPTTAAPTTAAPTTEAPPTTVPGSSVPVDGTGWSFGNTAPPSPWIQAGGHAYNGTLGWTAADGTKRQCGTRGVHPDPVLDTFCHATTRYVNTDGTWSSITSPATWKAKLANGVYDVTVTVGEARSHPGAVRHSVQVEGVPVHDRVPTSSATPFVSATRTVEVTDGLLDLSFVGGTKTKVVAVTVVPSTKTPEVAPSTTKAPTTTAAPTTTKAPTTTAAPTTTKAPTTTTAPTTTAAPTGGSGKQITIYDVTGIVQDFDQYAQPNFNWASGGSMFSPVNYADGTAYVRFQVTSKPTSIPMVGQMCFWYQYKPGSFQEYEETCSPKAKIGFTDETLIYANLGSPSGWWTQDGPKNRVGKFDWGKKPHVARIFLKDDKTKTLFIEERCGSACWSGGDARLHTPVKMNVHLIFVARGSSLKTPADWNNSPF